jgi:O-antigen/teichoic acid export membrane protein
MSGHALIIRNTLWASIETLLEATVPPLIGVWVARHFGPTKLGAFAYVMWLASLAVVAGHLGIASTVAKYLPEAMGQRDHTLARAIVREAWRLQALVSLAVTVLGLAWAQSLPAQERLYASLAIASVLPAGLMGIASSINQSFQNLIDNSISSIFGVLVQTTLTCTSMLADWGLEGLAAALLAGRALDCGYRIVKAQRCFAAQLGDGAAASVTSLNAQTRAELLRFSLQALGLMLLNVVVWSRSEMFFLKQMSSVEQVAFYSLAFGLGLIPKEIASPFAKAATAALYAESGVSKDRGTRVAELSTRYQALVVFPAALGLAVLSGPLVRLLYGASYFAAAPVLFFAAALGPIGHLVDPVTTLLRTRDEQRRLILWTAAIGLLLLGLDFWLVGWLAALGGALAKGLGQALLVLGLWWLASRLCNFNLPGVYLVRLFLASATMAAGVAALHLVFGDLLTLLLGIPTGIALFLVNLRIWRVFAETDLRHLAAVSGTLPVRFRASYTRLLNWIVAAPKPQTV